MLTCFKAIISEQNYCPSNRSTMQCNVSLSLKYVLTKGLNNFSVESKPFKEWKRETYLILKWKRVNGILRDKKRRRRDAGCDNVAPWSTWIHVKVSMIKQLNKQHFAYFGSSTGSRFLVIFLVLDMASQGVIITNSGWIEAIFMANGDVSPPKWEPLSLVPFLWKMDTGSRGTLFWVLAV